MRTTHPPRSRPHGLALSFLLAGLASLPACSASPPPPAATPPAATPPAAAPPPAPAPPSDAPVDAAGDAASHFPPAERPWRGSDYAAAATALRKLPLDALPRAASDRSGALFARLVNPESLDFALDRAAPFKARFEALLEVQSHVVDVLRAYLQAREKGGGLDHEVLALIAFVLHAGVVQGELTEELLPLLDPADPTYATRMAGLERARHGMNEMVQGALTSLTEPYARGELAAFALAVAPDLGDLCQRLTPANEGTARALIARITDTAPPGPVKQAFARLRAAVEAPPADVTVTAAAIFGRDVHAALVTLPADRSSGAAPRDKRGGAADLLIVPLHRAVVTAGPRRRAVVDVDPTTPNRLLVEVLFTLLQAGVEVYELRLLGQPAHHVRVRLPPRVSGPALPGLHLTALVVGGGVSVKATGSSVATGCKEPGAGITVPLIDGRQDLTGVRACALRLKGVAPQEREVVVTGGPAARAVDLVHVVEALRGDALELYPDVSFGIVR